MGRLTGRKIAALATDGFEHVELTEPVKALEDAGATITIVSPKSGAIQGMNHDKLGDKTEVDVTLASADPADFDGLLLPGGVANPDALRILPEAVNFVHSFVREGKPIAAICHGPWTLIEAGGVKGRPMTSWPSLKTDLQNAGALWSDEPVVREPTLVTSRKPEDIPFFVKSALEMFSS